MITLPHTAHTFTLLLHHFYLIYIYIYIHTYNLRTFQRKIQFYLFLFDNCTYMLLLNAANIELTTSFDVFSWNLLVISTYYYKCQWDFKWDFLIFGTEPGSCGFISALYMYGNVSWSTLVWTKMSQQVLDGLPSIFVQTFVFPNWWIVKTLAILRPFMYRWLT